MVIVTSYRDTALGPSKMLIRTVGEYGGEIESLAYLTLGEKREVVTNLSGFVVTSQDMM